MDLKELEAVPRQMDGLRAQIRLLQLQINELRNPQPFTPTPRNKEGQHWSEEDDSLLIQAYTNFIRLSATHLGRTESGIKTRLRRLLTMYAEEKRRGW